MINDPVQSNDNPSELSDLEIEQLLNASYDVPPMSRSLTKRLDQYIEQEWGRSPGLVRAKAPNWVTSLRLGNRWVRAISIAASLLFVVSLSWMLTQGASAYAWSTMVDAMIKQGIVSLPIDSMSSSDREERVLLFLLGDSAEVYRERLLGARVVSQKWKRLKRDAGDRETVALHVRFESRSKTPIDLNLLIDPRTQLPETCEVVGIPEADSVATTYRAGDSTGSSSQALADGTMPKSTNSSDKLALSNSLDLPPSAGTQRKLNAREEEVVLGKAFSNRDMVGKDFASMDNATRSWVAVEVSSRSSQEVIQKVDELLASLWKEHGVEPTEPAEDEELMRRVYLDLVGRIPSVSEVRSYLNEKSPNRYQQLVDRLLKSPDHSSHVATVWRSFLIPEGIDLSRFGGVEVFDRWLADRFHANASYDEVVKELLLAEGRLSRSGPLLFYSAAKLDPDQLASRTSRVFLGMRMECAQCHDHPFEPWKQAEFWGFAAFFAQISRPQGTLESVSTVMQVRDIDRGEVKMPESEATVPPRFLDGSEPANGANTESRRQQLVAWMIDPKNPFFARATANRVWAQMFGKGIVDPVDDFGLQHPPKSKELLDILASYLIDQKFNLRELFRTIAYSRAYQLSSGSKTSEPEPLEWFAQMSVKTLTAEQVYDCISVATMLDSPQNNAAATFNVTRFGNSERDQFLQQFRTPTGYSTDYLGGIPQALTLMNGTLIDSATGLTSSGLLRSLDAPFFTNRQRIEVLYLATLSRRPHVSEWDALMNYISDDTKGSQLQEGLADILWALLNSAEFTMNH